MESLEDEVKRIFNDVLLKYVDKINLAFNPHFYSNLEKLLDKISVGTKIKKS